MTATIKQVLSLEALKRDIDYIQQKELTLKRQSGPPYKCGGLLASYINREKNVAPFSQSEIDAITGGNAVEDIEPYCDDYLWK